MSDAEADTAPPEAASPSHPRHAQWVKEQTLAMEIAHQRRIGGTLRDAEDINRAALERLEARKRAGVEAGREPEDVEPNAGRAAREAARDELGLTRQIAPVLPVASSPCEYCGKCLRCKREARVHAIHERARQGDQFALALTWELVGAMLAHQARRDFKLHDGRVVPFSRMLLDGERNVAFLEVASGVCDRSVRLLGAWR